TLAARLRDDRPPGLPRAPLTVTFAGAAVGTDRLSLDPGNIQSVVTATLSRPQAGGRAGLVLASPTWNPKRLGAGARDENLGLRIETLSLVPSSGPPLRLIDAVPIQPYYAAPRWYYDTQSAHLADLWAWYLPAAGLPGPAGLVLAVLVVLLGGGSLAWGIVGLRQVPAGESA